MERAAYEHLVERSKRAAAEHPRWYRAKIEVWIAMGRAAPLAAGIAGLALLALLCAAVTVVPAILIFAKFFVLLLIPTVTALKSMILPLEPLPDVELRRRDHADLWAMVERIAAKADARVPWAKGGIP